MGNFQNLLLEVSMQLFFLPFLFSRFCLTDCPYVDIGVNVIFLEKRLNNIFKTKLNNS